MSRQLAPIGLSAYSRLSHVQRTVAALQANALAGDSELYVFSDAPKPGDEEKVAAVRRYLHTINGFRRVEIFERAENNRIANNRGGMRMLLERFGKMIFVEEDAVCAPSFLEYMNGALDAYAGDERIFALCGYFPPIGLATDYPYDVVMSPRMNAWAFGIWKDRFDSIEMASRPEMFSGIFNDPEKFRNYCIGGYAVIPQLQALSEGAVDGLDIRIDYSMFREGGRYTLCPVRSLVQPIGCDGSGEHWKHASSRHEVNLGEASKVFEFAAGVVPDERVLRKLRSFNNRALPFSLLMLMRLHRLGCYLPLRRAVHACRRLLQRVAG